MNINPGIKKTVEWLKLQGFKTTDSGDGKTHDFRCDRSYPYVSIIVEPEKLISECDRLNHLLQIEFGIVIYPLGFDPIPGIQATYDPNNKIGIIDLTFVDDEILGL